MEHDDRDYSPKRATIQPRPPMSRAHRVFPALEPPLPNSAHEPAGLLRLTRLSLGANVLMGGVLLIEHGRGLLAGLRGLLP